MTGGGFQVTLDPAFRHIIVNPSLAYNRRGPSGPAFTIFDTGDGLVEFVNLPLDRITPVNAVSIVSQEVDANRKIYSKSDGSGVFT